MAGDRSTAALATLGRNVAVLIEEVELTRLPGQRMNAPTAPGRYKVSKQLGSNERPLYLFTPSNVLEATSWNRHPCQRKAVLRVLMYASMVLNFVVQTSSCRPSSWLGDLKLTIFVLLHHPLHQACQFEKAQPVEQVQTERHALESSKAAKTSDGAYKLLLIPR
ncbi:hypothetical protein PHLCEN_2v6446 [Hermanssonia centrifuga]|uniref:Uncharacterized protein n=1 Tax=Hermanssonia centrifuga TaxID=98765 RepID=A0A2R6P040_9APHY|nr:hypothetical protein PHLCEN_2v6446 [Hermanssonia centrifuga]